MARSQMKEHDTMDRDVESQFITEEDLFPGDVKREPYLDSTRKKTDVRLLSVGSLLSMLLAYILGGTLLAYREWGFALIVLAVGYGLLFVLVSAGKMKMQMADTSRIVVLTAKRRRFCLGLELNVVALAAMAIGPGRLFALSSNLAGVLVGWSVVCALVGYYLAVSSYECRSVADSS